MGLSDIRSAIRAEIDATPSCFIFKVLKVLPTRAGWILDVQARPAHGGSTPIVLDESFCNASAWWARPTKGSARVQRVIPNESQIYLSNVNGVVPNEKQEIRLYPTNYLKPLDKCWSDDDWGEKAFACLKDLASPMPMSSALLSGDGFVHLRPAQLSALTLVNYSSSFLWGPPGTGKTTVLGILLAKYMQANPFARLLFLSTTNRAVDQATIEVDKALEHIGQISLRHTIRRAGSGFNQKLYAKREHLLAQAYPNVSSDEADDIGSVENEVDQSNAPSGSNLGNFRLITMTIARAVSTIASLRELPTFDLLVFDEASQIGLAHALAVMPLGKARLFAGDSRQLSPVATSTSSSVQRWFGQSAFAHKPASGPSVCLLNEQSRMIGPICDIVSEIFYEGELRVASDALGNESWLKARKRRFGYIPRNQHVWIEPVITNATYSSETRGLTRPESVERILQLIRSAFFLRNASQHDVIVITPFRLQRRLLQDALFRDNLTSVKVGTVHSTQGIEAPVVIFDPVDGLSPFLTNDVGKQLINVALSRAQSKLILMLSPRDLMNPLFSQMVDIVQRRENRPIRKISEVLSYPNYRTSAIGERVYLTEGVGEVTGFLSNGTSMQVVIELTGMDAYIEVDEFLERSM